MKANTPDLLKFKRLQRRLQVSIPALCGHLELLWLSTAKNAPEGDIGRFTNEDIAIGCYWDGDADEFVNALTDCGWLDSDEDYRLIVHDWSEHAPTYVRGFLARHKRNFANSTKQAAKEPTKQLTKEPAIGTCSEGVATKPNQAKPSQVKSSVGVENSDDTWKLSPSFVPFWDNWKKHLNQNRKPLSESTEVANLMELARRWPIEQDQIEVVQFSILRQAKNLILDGSHLGRASPKKISSGVNYDPEAKLKNPQHGVM